jgi:hypothetical protein
MADMRLFEPDYQVTELRLIQPLRHLTAKYAAFGIRADFAFASDDQDESETVKTGTLQKPRKGSMRAGLRHAVQVEPGFDIPLPAGELRAGAARA